MGFGRRPPDFGTGDLLRLPMEAATVSVMGLPA